MVSLSKSLKCKKTCLHWRGRSGEARRRGYGCRWPITTECSDHVGDSIYHAFAWRKCWFVADLRTYCTSCRKFNFFSYWTPVSCVNARLSKRARNLPLIFLFIFFFAVNLCFVYLKCDILSLFDRKLLLCKYVCVWIESMRFQCIDDVVNDEKRFRALRFRSNSVHCLKESISRNSGACFKGKIMLRLEKEKKLSNYDNLPSKKKGKNKYL